MNKTTHTCSVCGKPLSVVLGGKAEAERLCITCLISTYPKLKELAKTL